MALGIFASRLVGFLRERALAYFFGVGPHADVFRAALRAPNVLQNLLGEGTLSAAFIPVYSRLLAAGEREEAGRFAGAILGLLARASAGGASLLGVAPGAAARRRAGAGVPGRRRRGRPGARGRPLRADGAPRCASSSR